MSTNSDINTKLIQDTIMRYKYDNVQNIKLCLIELRNRNITIKEDFLSTICKHFSLTNKENLYNVDDVNQSIDIASSLFKKSYFTKFKISIIILFIINFIINISLDELGEIEKDTRRLLIGGFFAYKIAFEILKHYYPKEYIKINPYLFSLIVFMGMVIVQTILLVILKVTFNI